MANTGCAGSAIAVAPICLNLGITAPVLSCVMTWRGRIETKSPARTTPPGASPSACRAAIFSTRVRPISILRIPDSQQSTLNYQLLENSLLGSALSQKLSDIEVYEVGVMENDRLDRAFHLIALVTV